MWIIVIILVVLIFLYMVFNPKIEVIRRTINNSFCVILSYNKIEKKEGKFVRTTEFLTLIKIKR